MKLSELKTGEKASIVKVLGHGGFRKRIIEMGFVKGKVVEALLDAPLHDPVKYRVMGYDVSMRRSEASLVEVVSLEEAKKALDNTNSYSTILIEEKARKLALTKRKEITVALVGNPNSGKTTLFNLTSGAHERVGNYSGVTVESKESFFEQDGYRFKIIDLPGTYSLTAYSPEEKYVRSFLIEEKPDIVINVVDASNLERNLYLTTQLIDMHLNTVVALNMYDELKNSGNILDYKLLGDLLGMPFIPVIAKSGFGIINLFRSVIKIYERESIVDEDGVLIQSLQEDEVLDEYHHKNKIPHRHGEKNGKLPDHISKHKFDSISRHIHINYGQELEKSINRLTQYLVKENNHLQSVYSFRYLSLKLLERDKEIENLLAAETNGNEIIALRDEETKRVKSIMKDEPETLISDAKYGFIAGALKESFQEEGRKPFHSHTTKLDKILTHRFFGYPIFILFLYIMFQATFTLGEYPMNWIESGVTWLGSFIGKIMNPGPLKDLIIDGIIGGVGGVIVFLPNILILYFFISIMEDTGYMSRAAFIMDKLMHKIGLHGKSFIPLIMGFGCNVPAIMASRTIENRNSRMITILINPFMSCSARLPVYILLAGAFFPQQAGLVLFSIYFLGILIAIGLALLFKKFLFKKDETPFVMELPPYRMPSRKSILIHTWDKGKQYLKKMGTIILFASIVIWFLGYFPQQKSDELAEISQTEQLENSYIGKIGKTIQPVLAPLGFDWKISVALLSGVAAKEIVISTLGVIYAVDDENLDKTLPQKLQAEYYSDGSPVYTHGTALAFMVFVLIYFPCIATIVAVKNETGTWKWAWFEVVISLTLAWIMAFAVQLIF